MGNWWIDEAPYPGPDRELTAQEAFDELKRAASAVTGHFKAVYGPTARQMQRQLSQWYVAFDPAQPDVTFYFTSDGKLRQTKRLDSPQDETEPEELRRRALERVKNRNTGPRSQCGFDNRNGRRLH